MKRSTARAATSVELTAGTEPPREVELMPAGEVPTRPHDGRSAWRNPNAAAVVDATRALSLDLAIDYEHQGLRARDNGQPAPAAGWIRRVFERAGAVWGEVEWTERAAAMLTAREYRFLSPVFDYERATRLVTRIVGAGLTNDPALYMRAIATTEPEGDMEELLKKLAQALGLESSAGEDAIVAAASAAAAAAAETPKLRTALGLPADTLPANVTVAAGALVASRRAIAVAAGLAEDATGEAIEGAVRTARASTAPEPGAFVPRAEFDALRARLDSVETTGAQASATAAVDQAVKDGKVTPASREWALGYATKDPDGFAAFVKDAPAILADGRVAPATPPGEGGDTLTAAERAVCRATGVSEEDFIKSRKALAGEREEG